MASSNLTNTVIVSGWAGIGGPIRAPMLTANRCSGSQLSVLGDLSLSSTHSLDLKETGPRKGSKLCFNIHSLIAM